MTVVCQVVYGRLAVSKPSPVYETVSTVIFHLVAMQCVRLACMKV